MDEGSGVHDVLQSFARSLKSFVQSREFLEHRRINTLLKKATSAAIANKDIIRANQQISYELELTSSTIRSVSQFHLYDPAERMARVAALADAFIGLPGSLAVRRSMPHLWANG